MLTTGIEPATVGLLDQCSTDWATRAHLFIVTLCGGDMILCVYDNNNNIHMPGVGFEPTHPKITELKSAALDRSAIQASTTTEGFEPPRVKPIRFRI